MLAYVKTGFMQESFEVQAEICETYRLDFAKYSKQADKYCLNAVLMSVAQRVGQQIKYSKLADGYTNPTLKKAFNLLCLAGVIRKISSADPSGLPLGARASDKIFKALIVDIGLMRYLSGMPVGVEYGKRPNGFVFSTRPYEEVSERGITYIPLYFIFSATGGVESKGRRP